MGSIRAPAFTAAARASFMHPRSASHQHLKSNQNEGFENAKDDSLSLNTLPLLPHQLRDVRNLDRRVRLDDAQEVLLEEVVVQRREVRADRWVG